jgi:hypothetical protein
MVRLNSIWCAEGVPILQRISASAKFHFLDAFPVNANGKADRKKLAESLA